MAGKKTQTSKKAKVVDFSDESVLEAMLDQLCKSTGRASAAIDNALSVVNASNKRIRAMERRKKYPA